MSTALRTSALVLACIVFACTPPVVPPTCDDGERNGTETAIDCGGADCGPCADGLACATNDDCSSGLCPSTKVCTAHRCGDGVLQAGVEACDDGNDVDTDACTNACKPAECGDGVTQAGVEDCDDGNELDTDACTNDCEAADCGDGITQAGVEDCDDANEVDTDACTNACTAADCGDGITQAGVEACDDGNEVDTDACTNACQPAECGDGITRPDTEECDDANEVDDDACSNGCVAAGCDDETRNAGETDVDCGGPDCAPCATSRTCSVDGDCTSGQCVAAACVPVVRSCLALQAVVPGLASGRYRLDLDDEGPLAPMLAECDFDTDGGGWMLVLEYLHQGGTNPGLTVLTDRLPLASAGELRTDGSTDAATWGHTGNALFAATGAVETRWFARTDFHDRVIHFKSSHPDLTAYLATGTGCAKPFVYSPEFSTDLPGRNNSTLPLHAIAGDGFCDQGDRAMTEFPFFGNSAIEHPRAHWGIRGLGERWEVDDNPSGQGSCSSCNDTHHRVWIRANACDGHKNAGESDVDCGANSLCGTCGADKACTGGDDCASGVCSPNGRCLAPTCDDERANGNETDVDCGGPDCNACPSGKRCETPGDCTTSYCNTGTCLDVASSCTMVKQGDAAAADGTYTIDPDGAGDLPPMPASCDMTTEGGGWTLVLNYLHKGGTNPELTVRATSLPLLGSDVLGTDESSSTTAWGHAGTAVLSRLPFNQTMWFGKSSLHARVIHFETRAPDVTSYLKTGFGCARPGVYDAGFGSNLALYANATLPFFTNGGNDGMCNKGDFAMTDFPIFSNSGIGHPRAHWGIRGTGERWEVDDVPAGSGSCSTCADTLHRVWVRETTTPAP